MKLVDTQHKELLQQCRSYTSQMGKYHLPYICDDSGIMINTLKSLKKARKEFPDKKFLIIFEDGACSINIGNFKGC